MSRCRKRCPIIKLRSVYGGRLLGGILRYGSGFEDYHIHLNVWGRRRDLLDDPWIAFSGRISGGEGFQTEPRKDATWMFGIEVKTSAGALACAARLANRTHSPILTLAAQSLSQTR